ncbi:hypothetical protein GJ744_004519 [Endocarpon pusillum]|uniref:Uncharacterized protein n=1 Tax=Endocarpon pusillum TaxID=364733 RepID=A0A8H7E8D5_9EURO|nr:hypothetical protein GJ744_004519 [Endocarpon pusillum]
MLLSSRQNPPRLSLQRVNSHNNLAAARALLSSSPLPSPGLPSNLPRHGKKPPRINSRRLLRLTIWLAVCTLLFLAVGRIVRSDQSSTLISYVSPDSQAYQVVDKILPEEPSPVVVTDQRGRSKWTISIPPALDFPLTPAQYASICKTSMEMSQQVAMLKKAHSGPTHMPKAHHDYYFNDQHFMDITDAESHDVLPGVRNVELLRLKTASSQEDSLRQCDRSMIYALETSAAGLGPTLLGLWLAYGLAQSEKRAFFIDDTNWPYGSYSTYFKAPPSPGCLAPPKTQIVPCPHQARHLLVSAATVAHTFGHSFNEHFEDGRKMGVMRQHKIFAMMRAGFETLFQDKLNKEDQAYLNDRTAELNNTIRASGGEEIGVHIRHGDRHPLEYQYQKSYIPLEKYLDTAYNLSVRVSQASPSQILVASDDPDIYTDPLITSSITTPKIERAQSHISLASKKTLAASGKAGLGWEGGFFKDVFWALGVPAKDQIPRMIKPAQPPRRHAEPGGEDKDTAARSSVENLDPHKKPSEAALKLRELIARSYLLDLAVLGQSDKIVCAVSSYGCRILAVMMGWERGIVQGGWRNVDGEFSWRGLDY